MARDVQCVTFNIALRHAQRVVAEILIVLSVKEPGENWQVMVVAPMYNMITCTSHVHQGETYNGNVFELPVTWVTKCPEKGRLTVTYSRFARLRD